MVARQQQVTPATTTPRRNRAPMTTWKIDTAHTQVNFSAKHMMVTNVRGTFHDVDGTIELDENDPTRSRGEFRVGAASVDTNFGARDTHLRSADFFDAERFPEITFVSTDVDAGRRRPLQRHRRPHDPRRHEAAHVRCRARGDRPRHERRAPRGPVAPRPSSRARTGASTGTSPSSRAAGWSARRSSSRSPSRPTRSPWPSPPISSAARS